MVPRKTVVGLNDAKGVEIVKGAKTGVKYSTANGEEVDNEGEKHMLVCSVEGVSRGVVAQVTDVTKPLLSVSKMVKSGHQVVFDSEGSYIKDKATGEVMNLEEVNGLYKLKAWVKRAEDFQG